MNPTHSFAAWPLNLCYLSTDCIYTSCDAIQNNIVSGPLPLILLGYLHCSATPRLIYPLCDTLFASKIIKTCRASRAPSPNLLLLPGTLVLLHPHKCCFWGMRHLSHIQKLHTQCSGTHAGWKVRCYLHEECIYYVTLYHGEAADWILKGRRWVSHRGRLGTCKAGTFGCSSLCLFALSSSSYISIRLQRLNADYTMHTI